MTGHQDFAASSTAEPSSPARSTARSRFWPLALGAVGVVFGDIGTSPLYAFKLALAESGPQVGAEAVLGVLSLALWALILVVTVKYVILLMRADNRGEGGVLALAALVQHATGRRTLPIFLLGVAGAALFYGDAVITPAMSVLAAVEGLRSVPHLEHIGLGVVLVISLVVLVGLFAAQSKGTAGVAKLFGPTCLVWFLAIGALGVLHLLKEPQVIVAFNPLYGASFLIHHGLVGFLVLGSVFLTVTGGEALYADMGHFGRWPIQAAWFFLVLPALFLNYLGQGAFALHAIRLAGGHTVQNADWFYQMAPELLRAPLVLLSLLATIIASQAVITGAFSLTNSAMQLGWLPRMEVRRTSATEAGQIFMPQVNMMLMIGVIFLVSVFKSSDALGHAYGLAVTGTMAVTTTLFFIYVRRGWGWALGWALALIVPLLTIDLIFLTANMLKLFSGGFVPLVIGAGVFAVMLTWVEGSGIVGRKIAADTPRLDEVLPHLSARSTYRAPGTAVFMTSDPDLAPGALLHNLKHNRVLHRKNLIVSVRTADVPRVAEFERATLDRISEDFTRVSLTYGFMEEPNVPRALAGLRKQGIAFDIMSTSFFLGRRTMVRAANSKLPKLFNTLFIWMTRNAADPTDVFHIPPGRVVQLGAQVSV
ncbi:MAG: trkD [Phenylobacterium sp.]|nr:trkD [Phenylobacterium sp.]